MKQVFDFIVMSSHHSGTISTLRFLSSFSDISIMSIPDTPLSVQNLEIFLNDSPGKVKGLMLKNSRYSEAEAQKIIDKYTSSDSAVLEISREPLKKMISVLDFHIYNWALTFTGLYSLPLEKLDFGKFGNTAYTRRFLASDMMTTQCTLGPIFRQKYNRYMHISMQDINPANAIVTLNKFRGLMGLPASDIQFPVDTVFSRKNSFSNYIRAMYFKGISIKPCPLEHLTFRGYTKDDICLTVEPAEVNFPLGDFSGKLAFCFCNKQLDPAIKADIHRELDKERHLIVHWCDKMAQLYAKGLKLYEMFEYDEEKLRAKFLADPKALTPGKKYLLDYLNYYGNHEPAYLVQCLPTIKFLASLS